METKIRQFNKARQAWFNAAGSILKNNTSSAFNPGSLFRIFYDFYPNFSVHCDLLNATICSVTETSETVSVGVYNTGGIKFNSVMTLPFHDPKEISISENIPFDLIPISKVKERVRGNRGKANYELLFIPELQDGFHSCFTSEFRGHTSRWSMSEVVFMTANI